MQYQPNGDQDVFLTRLQEEGLALITINRHDDLCSVIRHIENLADPLGIKVRITCPTDWALKGFLKVEAVNGR